LATEKSDNPDLRDRGYVYWRLLSTDPAAAKSVVLATRPEISAETFLLPKDYLVELLDNISTLASVYHRSPGEFARGTRKVVFKARSDGEGEQREDSSERSAGEEVSDDEQKNTNNNKDNDNDNDNANNNERRKGKELDNGNDVDEPEEEEEEEEEEERGTAEVFAELIAEMRAKKASWTFSEDLAEVWKKGI